jgi:protein-S-isoprenylcysteine O-methyltransferase Ste14
MKTFPKSMLFVAVQFLCLGYFVVTGHIFVAPSIIWIELAGIAVALWAVLTVRPNRVNPFPDLRRNTRLVMRGPYRWIRHPMYTGVLLVALAWLLDNLTLARLLVGLVLLADLLAKANYEESLLRKRFPEYVAYQKRTKRLIPFVY